MAAVTICRTVCSLPGSSVQGILQAKCWSGLPFPSPGYIPNPGTELRFPKLQVGSLSSEPPGKPGVIVQYVFGLHLWHRVPKIFEISLVIMVKGVSLVIHIKTLSILRGKESESENRSVTSDCLRPHGLYSPWNSLGQNTGVGCLFSSRSFQPRDRTQVSHIEGRFLPTEL